MPAQRLFHLKVRTTDGQTYYLTPTGAVALNPHGLSMRQFLFTEPDLMDATEAEYQRLNPGCTITRIPVRLELSLGAFRVVEVHGEVPVAEVFRVKVVYVNSTGYLLAKPGSPGSAFLAFERDLIMGSYKIGETLFTSLSEATKAHHAFLNRPGRDDSTFGASTITSVTMETLEVAYVRSTRTTAQDVRLATKDALFAPRAPEVNDHAWPDVTPESPPMPMKKPAKKVSATYVFARGAADNTARALFRIARALERQNDLAQTVVDRQGPPPFKPK